MNFNQNNLSSESSPYLLQHQNNPVWWQAWSDEILQFAQEQNKPIIISIGYSACHWCHVMEHECFENEEVAKLMNEYFICIKIDREERPDLDSIYMNALHLMNNQGGWPLNVIALPNGKPFFGGTYFPQAKWIHFLNQISQKYKSNFSDFEKYANNLSIGINQTELIQLNENIEFTTNFIENQIKKISQTFDRNWGGFTQTPKFPIPVIWNFLLRNAIQTKNKEVENQVKLTLDRMIWGSMYDQIGGGFSRYSVDAYWKIPHFEKMLYDNGQLLSLYAMAYKFFKDEKYSEIIEHTISWLENEMLSTENGFYSAYDADSEGTEGKFYVWKIDELKEILQESYPIFSQYYNVEGFGVWEENNSVFIQLEDENTIALKLNTDALSLQNLIKNCKEKLFIEREKRVKPQLDDKILSSWNALTISGLAHSYQALGNEKYLKLAENAFQFIQKNLFMNGKLYRTFKNNEAKIPGFLDDYSFLLQASLDLYETTFNKKYLDFSIEIVEQINFNFLNKKSLMYNFRSQNERLLIAETYPVNDSVEPSGNAVMAMNLFRLGKMLSNENYLNHSKQMLKNVLQKVEKYPSGYGLWLQLYMNFTVDFNEIVIMGNDFLKFKNQLQKEFIPNAIFVGNEKEEYIELMKYRYSEEETLIYVCKNNACLLPENEVEEVLEKFFE